MHVGKFATVAAVTLALGGCATLQKARDRIVKAPSRCVDQTVQIYFEPDSVDVTPDGRAVIQAAAENARGCQVTAVEVVGLADATGQAGPNLDLSKRRAQSVTAALAHAGLPAAEFKVSAAGDRGAVASDGAAAPLRRRADVTLRLSDRK